MSEADVVDPAGAAALGSAKPPARSAVESSEHSAVDATPRSAVEAPRSSAVEALPHSAVESSEHSAVEAPPRSPVEATSHIATAAPALSATATQAHRTTAASAHTAAAALTPAVASVASARAADEAWRTLHQEASAPYRRCGRFAWHFARGKLGHDPVFRAMLEQGLLCVGARVLDIGCGQGLLASLLQSCDDLTQRGQWPADWPMLPALPAASLVPPAFTVAKPIPPAMPAGARYTGIELMPSDVARATSALATLPSKPRFICADMCHAELAPSDVVVILDVLHYVGHKAQAELLARVRAALAPHGRLLLRVGDAGRSWAYALSQWVDRGVTLIRGHRAAPTWGRTLPQWTALLSDLGFAVQALPMSRGTPFANVLLVCELAQARR